MKRLFTNLWEALTHRSTCEHRGDHHQAEDNELLTALGRSARWGGQELSLEATTEGWEIKVFSCYGGGCSNCDPDLEIVITIPKDRRRTPRVEECER